MRENLLVNKNTQIVSSSRKNVVKWSSRCVVKRTYFRRRRSIAPWSSPCCRIGTCATKAKSGRLEQQSNLLSQTSIAFEMRTTLYALVHTFRNYHPISPSQTWVLSFRINYSYTGLHSLQRTCMSPIEPATKTRVPV